jgi:hypothetical protein
MSIVEKIAVLGSMVGVCGAGIYYITQNNKVGSSSKGTH